MAIMTSWEVVLGMTASIVACLAICGFVFGIHFYRTRPPTSAIYKFVRPHSSDGPLAPQSPETRSARPTTPESTGTTVNVDPAPPRAVPPPTALEEDPPVQLVQPPVSYQHIVLPKLPDRDLHAPHSPAPFVAPLRERPYSTEGSPPVQPNPVKDRATRLSQSDPLQLKPASHLEEEGSKEAKRSDHIAWRGSDSYHLEGQDVVLTSIDEPRSRHEPLRNLAIPTAGELKVPGAPFSSQAQLPRAFDPADKPLSASHDFNPRNPPSLSHQVLPNSPMKSSEEFRPMRYATSSSMQSSPAHSLMLSHGTIRPSSGMGLPLADFTVRELISDERAGRNDIVSAEGAEFGSIMRLVLSDWSSFGGSKRDHYWNSRSSFQFSSA